jgi:hypothetical protein
LDYLRYLPEGHKSVEFNRVDVNIQITSWNRLVIAAGGPIWELGAGGVLAGYAVVGLFVMIRSWMAGGTSTSWQFACLSASQLVCCQLLPYELVLTALFLPYLAELLTSSVVRDRLLGIAGGLLLFYTLMPGGEGSFAEALARMLAGVVQFFGAPEQSAEFFRSHRALGTLGICMLILGRGPVLSKTPKEC